LKREFIGSFWGYLSQDIYSDGYVITQRPTKNRQMKEEKRPTNSCDCLIGICHNKNEMMYKSDALEILTYNSNGSKQMERHGFVKQSFDALDYLDRRRGFCSLFNYCPHCGIKIDWKEVKAMFATPQLNPPDR
jgi:hypothetical protein